MNQEHEDQPAENQEHTVPTEAVVEEAPAQPEVPAQPETPVHVEEPAPVVEEPAPVKEHVRTDKYRPNVAVAGLDQDEVHLANCVYMNRATRKSLSVHHLQRRLTELGFNDADADKDGWYGELTKLAVEKFQNSKGLTATGLLDEETFTLIFAGDPHVNIVV